MPPHGKVHIAPIEDADIPEAFQAMSQGFGHTAPFVDAYFIAHDTPKGQEQGTKRLQEWKDTSPESAFMKAVTVQDGKENIIGLGIWTYMVEKPPQTLEELEGKEKVEEYWPDEKDREWMEAIWREYVKYRTRAILNSQPKGVYVLELLAVHPEYRRLGAGAALVKWGLSYADERNIGVVIEGTPSGAPLYERCGLHREIDEMEFDVKDELRDKMPKLSFFVKSATSVRA